MHAKSSGLLQGRPAAKKLAPPAANIKGYSPHNISGTLDSGSSPNIHENNNHRVLAIIVPAQARE